MRVHRYTLATAFATFVLLVAGGLVSTTESGLACPDWPLCEGQFIPRMVGGKEFEHSHRLVASFVGAMTFGLFALLSKHRRSDRLLVRLGAAAAALVVVQALLGALTVKLKLPPWVSSTHLGVAMAFFALVVTLCHFTYQRLPGAKLQRLPEWEANRLAPWLLVAAGLTYVQLVVGAAMRHTRGGLACGFDFPLCLGELWPVDEHLAVQLHMAHRTLGMVVGLAICWVSYRLYRADGASRTLRALAIANTLGVVAQVGLGIATLLLSRELIVMTLHSSLGALLWAGMVSAYWLVRPVAVQLSAPVPSSDLPRPSLELA